MSESVCYVFICKRFDYELAYKWIWGCISCCRLWPVVNSEWLGINSVHFSYDYLQLIFEMESIQQNYNDNFMEHASSGSPSSPDISNIVGAAQLNPRIGHEYQVEVSSMIEEPERLQLLMNPADSEVVHDNSLFFAIGLPILGAWKHNEVEDSGHEGWGYLGDIDRTVNAIKPAKTANVKKNGMSGDSKSGELGKSKKYKMAPGTSSNSWSDADAKSFLLGLFVFGKNFIQIKRFLENKGMGEILSFYYGKFYKSDEYRRWSSCRKIKGRKCMIGQKFFTGRRQHELLSRLIPHVSEESQDTLLQVSKSYVEGRASLEKYISSLKSIVGLGVLVEAVGIGKEKEDLTSLSAGSGKNNRLFSARTSKSWSSLAPSDIIKLLTGGFRLSKAKSKDLFWEAVWPRLLARGWHSEQPKNQGYVNSKDYLVFLMPGVENFSRRKLVRGDHYFDSVSDVLSKVVAEPNLLELEEETKVGNCNEEPETGSYEDDQSDYHLQCYLKPRASTYNTAHMEFMVIDTSLMHGGKSSGLRELKSVPGNSVGKVEVDAAAITYKGANRTRKVNRDKVMLESINQKLTKFRVIDSSMLYDGKLLKVRELRYPQVELEDASKMTGLSGESKRSSSDDDSPSVVEANMQMYGKNNISNTDSQKDISDCNATNQKEAYDNPHINASKMVESQQNQKSCVSDDNQLKRTIKHQFSRRPRSGHSNHAVLPIKRRRLTACAKAESSHVIEKSTGGLGSEELAFSQSSSFPDANENVGDPVSDQQNGSSIASSADRIVEESKQESILNENCQCMSVSCVKDEKCEAQSPINFNIPQVLSKPENGEMMAMVEEDGQTLKANDPSMEQQPKINPRRQSTRNRPLTVRALESLANEFLHVQRRQKRKDIQIHKDAFSPCRRARTKGKTMLRRHSSDHGTAVLVEEKHLNGDSSASEISANH
ncbi:uncharacterized protein LOC133293903 [Gastrolobium bilobum]|uniref:uncharacterized protein LOC133293903 n=1 Tax=Gastrolobium bilobum TaxID=150636 RepID=UPI002AB26C5E|nr:uncharacterized protein LOC133293903 [Gastrolobium bilobum]